MHVIQSAAVMVQLTAVHTPKPNTPVLMGKTVCPATSPRPNRNY